MWSILHCRRSGRGTPCSLGLASCGTPPDGSTSSVGRVVVSERMICHQLSGDVELAVQPSVLQAFFLGEDGTTYQVVPPLGVSNNQATFVIPEGRRYLLQVGSTLFETDQRTVDIITEAAYRCMPAPDTGQTTTPGSGSSRPVAMASCSPARTATPPASPRPATSRFDSDRRIPGGLASVRAAWGGARTIEPYLEIEAKTGGWVAGDVYLDRNLSVRTGLIVRLL